jgi:hypothetical protein
MRWTSPPIWFTIGYDDRIIADGLVYDLLVMK